jgi:hypothetical protein
MHALVLDGVYPDDGGGGVAFHPAPRLSAHDVAQVAAAIRARVTRLVDRRDVGEIDPGDEAALAASCGASLGGYASVGPRAGLRVRREGTAPAPDAPRGTPLHAHDEGFDLHAALAVAQHRRDRLENLCRYLLRPALSHDRVALRADGSVVLTLKTPWRDGTRRLVLDPLEFMERLAAIVPRPRKNLVVYHGVLSPRAKLRPRVVPRPPARTGDGPSRPRHRWSDLMRRAFEIDVRDCSCCGGTLELVETITDPAKASAILASLGLPAVPPPASPARAPPPAAWLEPARRPPGPTRRPAVRRDGRRPPATPKAASSAPRHGVENARDRVYACGRARERAGHPRFTNVA